MFASRSSVAADGATAADDGADVLPASTAASTACTSVFTRALAVAVAARAANRPRSSAPRRRYSTSDENVASPPATAARAASVATHGVTTGAADVPFDPIRRASALVRVARASSATRSRVAMLRARFPAAAANASTAADSAAIVVAVADSSSRSTTGVEVWSGHPDRS